MASRKQIRLATLRRTITDSQQWRIEILGREGGFSYKCIAKRVFGSDSKSDIYQVGRALKRAELRVRDWRDGKTKQSRSAIAAILSTKQKVG